MSPEGGTLPGSRNAVVGALFGPAEVDPAARARYVSAMVEEHYAAGELVVRQNEVGDRLFIVAQGTAEVTAAGAKGEVPLASLAVGDLFGELALLEPGSLRHATVTAVEPLTALSLRREHVEQLWDSVPGLRAHVDAARDRLLVRRLLKLSRPFATLTGEMLAVLERRVERVRVPAGHDVIRQGESGDRAYLLAEGKAQVIIEHGGAARQLAVLEPGALFGEAALLTGLQRNATVRTILDCDLLVLRRDDFLEVVAADRGAGMKIMQLLRLRDMPLRELAVEVFDTTTPEGDPIRILKNPVRRTYFRLSGTWPVRLLWPLSTASGMRRRSPLAGTAAFGCTRSAWVRTPGSRDGRSGSYAGVGYPMMTVRRRAASLWPRTWASPLVQHEFEDSLYRARRPR